MRKIGACTELAAACILVSFSSTELLAQKRSDAGTGFAKGDSVVVAIPRSLELIRLTGVFGTNVKHDFHIRRRPNGGAEILDTTGHGNPDWREQGFATLDPLGVESIKTVTMEDKSKRIEITLRYGNAIMRNMVGDMRLFIPVDQPDVIRQVIALAGQADSVRQISYAAIGALFFRGPLTSFSQGERNEVLRWADLSAKSARVDYEAFKGVGYVVVALPGNGDIWNNLQVNQAKRVGRMISDRFPLLKAFAKLSAAKEPIGGLKLMEPSCHGTAPYYTDKVCDIVEAYFPLTELLKFREADITSQQLLNASIILVKGDRVEVSLVAQ